MTIIQRVKDLPWISIFLLLLACIHWEYHGETSSISLPGLSGGLVVLGIVALVVLYRIYKALKNVCATHGIDTKRFHSKYDVLIPIAVIPVLGHAIWYGPTAGSHLQGGAEYRWTFEWGDSNWGAAFLVVLVSVVYLLRILAMLRALGGNQEQPRLLSETRG